MEIQDIDEAVGIAVSVVRNIQLRRVFDAKPESDQNFWRVISGNFTDIVAIDWCKLFGNDDREHQPAHWKNIIPTSDHGAFRSGLLKALEISHEQWIEYRRDFKNYRDRNAAHLDVRSPRPAHYPTFEIALQATFYYYEWIVKLAQGKGLVRQFPDLRRYAERFKLKCADMADAALLATKSIIDDVR